MHLRGGGAIMCEVVTGGSAFATIKVDCDLPRLVSLIHFVTTIENLLHNVSLWGSEAVGLVARLGYSRQGSRASNRLG